jgi:DNA-binding NarL/FixJ family response regulator
VIKILLVDDQSIVREGLRAMFSLEVDLNVVGEAANGKEALRIVNRLAPDVILLDIRMPDMDGLTALARLKAAAPRASVVMLTLYDDRNYLLRAIADGAAGYILKDSSREELVRAVRIVADGGAIVAPSMLPEVLKRVGQMGAGASSWQSAQPVETLTGRELQVLRLVAQGYSNQEIAEQLIVSPTTIKSHVQNILRKLDASDRTQAAVQAVRRGLI